ncbi:hypothetical protein [Salinicola aestuarinus]|uniref:hypothetical protein n=1 Tax=Salinicola aestuarinus TaxID=1949082 RepID=UPI000DA11A6C|nr:hypothetical protein [Salinicola aestuarinus]
MITITTCRERVDFECGACGAVESDANLEAITGLAVMPDGTGHCLWCGEFAEVQRESGDDVGAG